MELGCKTFPPEPNLMRGHRSKAKKETASAYHTLDGPEWNNKLGTPLGTLDGEFVPLPHEIHDAIRKRKERGTKAVGFGAAFYGCNVLAHRHSWPRWKFGCAMVPSYIVAHWFANEILPQNTFEVIYNFFGYPFFVCQPYVKKMIKAPLERGVEPLEFAG